MLTAGSKFPCPWCRTSIDDPDVPIELLDNDSISIREPIRDMRESDADNLWQKKNTWNFMHLSSDLSKWTDQVISTTTLSHQVGTD